MKILEGLGRFYHFDIFAFAETASEQRIRWLTALALFWVCVIALSNLYFSATLLGMFDNEPGIGMRLTAFSPVELITLTEAQRGYYGLLFLTVFYLCFIFLLNFSDLYVLGKVNDGRLPWENIFVHSVAQVLIGVLIFVELPVQDWVLNGFNTAIAWLDKIDINMGLPFIWVALFIYVIDDILFYIGHRLCHNVRFMWKLGHMTHHRNRQLSQPTTVPDFPFFFLNGSTGSFVTLIIGRAIFFKMLADISAAEAVMATLVITLLKIINHTVSHSISAYELFSRYRWLAWWEKFFVTGRVHYTHHSSLPEHNVANGCNFAAQFVWIDKLLGTYGKPVNEIPPTGLFHDPNYPGNPWKYSLEEWRKMLLELRYNKLRYWPKILFGHATYEPPVPVRVGVDA